MAWVPSVGTGVGDDYDPGKQLYEVPVVNKDLLIQRGGNYISEYVPPVVVMKDKTEFVLVSHKVVDTYRLTPSGRAKIPAAANGIPDLPGPKPRDVQERRVPLISESVMARYGLMSTTGRLPCVTLTPDPAQPPIKFFAVSPTLQQSKGMLAEAHLVVPNPNPTGPYPLRLTPKYAANAKDTHSERFAIPPPPTEGPKEFMTAKDKTLAAIEIGVIAMVGIGLFVLIHRRRKRS